MQKTIKSKGDLIRLISVLLASVWSGVVGVLFIVQVWRIFSLGAMPFTRERVAVYFSQISVFVWLWIAILFINEVIHAVFPAPVKKLRASVNEATISRRLQTRLSPETAKNTVWRTEKLRFILAVVCVGICASVFFLCVALLLTDDYVPVATQGFFAQHEEAERLLLCLPTVFSALLAVATFAYFQKATYKIEINRLKSSVASPETQIVSVRKGFWNKVVCGWERVKSVWDKFPRKKCVLALRISLGVIAVAFIVWGVCNGGMQDVFEKAVVICKQCVGIG